MNLFKTALFRIRLCWAALRGRQSGMYANLLDGKSVAYKLSVLGSITTTDRGIVVDCLVSTEADAGIVVGDGGFVYNCVVSGVNGYGFGRGTDYSLPRSKDGAVYIDYPKGGVPR